MKTARRTRLGEFGNRCMSIAFFDLPLSDTVGARGGTGIEFASMVRFMLSQQLRVAVRIVKYIASRQDTLSIWRRVRTQIISRWCNLCQLLGANEDVLLFVYPKIPFSGPSKAVAGRALVWFIYALLIAKTKISGQNIVILITDLPLEQQMLTDPLADERDLPAKLAAFHDASDLSLPDKLRLQTERLLLRNAYLVVSLSNLMTDHIIKKHGLPSDKICLRGRNAFAPTYATVLPTIRLPGENGLRVFYSGDLAAPTVITSLKRILSVLAHYPCSHLFLAGQHGEWLREEVRKRGLDNVHYLGALDFGTHDAVAQACDVGILLYTHAYAHLVLTSKYSAYVANGLAVLSTNLLTLSAIIAEDGVGVTVPVRNLPTQLESWLQSPTLVAPYKKRARRLSKQYTEGLFMQEWFARLLDKVGFDCGLPAGVAQCDG